LSVYGAYNRTRAQRQILSQVGVLIEGISRSIRTGRYVTCGETTLDADAFASAPRQNCFSVGNPASAVSFLDQSGRVVEYRISGGSIERSVNNGDFISLTDPEIVTVDNFVIHVRGAVRNPSLDECVPQQPYVLISVQGRSVVNFSGQPYTFNLQSGSAQRYLDIPDSVAAIC
jgi:hypothetical protein